VVAIGAGVVAMRAVVVAAAVVLVDSGGGTVANPHQ
jgi:hypothetical protein